MKALRLFCMTAALAGMFAAASVQAQQPASPREETSPLALDSVSIATSAAPTDIWPADATQNQDPAKPAATPDVQSSPPDGPKPQASPSTPAGPDEDYGKQGKRILGVIPNYRAVSANTHLPPLNFKSAVWLATQDTFDYSGFILVGALAGLDMAGKSQPTFGQGAEGFGKYYWHTFADNGIENYMTEAIIPAATREDPRYYTMGKGGFVKRTGYAVSRLFITRTNSGGSTFNLSEIVGAGAAAGIGNAYYPAQNNQWVKTYQRWGTQVGLDGAFNALKEFWPDINKAVFHGKY